MSDTLDFTRPTRVRPAPDAPGITVAHLGAAPKPYVYVGREMRGIPASPLGNPYRGDGAIVRFRAWLRDAYKAKTTGRASLEQGRAVDELRRLVALYREEGRLTLACWCATGPNPDDGPCHADVIAQAVVGLVRAEALEIEVPGLGCCCAHWDAETAVEGFPWHLTKDGRLMRISTSLKEAVKPWQTRAVLVGRRGPVVVVLSGSRHLEALGYGKCDSCGEVKPGIGHKEICADCRAWARRQHAAA